MAKFGTFTFGAPNKFGSTAYTEGGDIVWVVSVDWNNDGIFDGDNEAAYMIDLHIKRGRENYTKPGGGGFEATRPGKATLTMDNKDQRYDPRNAAGALYDNIVPGRRIRIIAVETSDGTHNTVFTGQITDIIPLGGPLGEGRVRIECADWLQTMDDQKLTSTAATLHTTITGAFEILLADARYQGAINLDTDTQPVYVYAISEQRAGDVAHQLAEAALGNIFVDVNGAFRFYARNHSYGTATALDEANCLTNIVVSQPWDEVYTYINVTAHKWIKEQPSIIYFLSNPIAFAQYGTVYAYPEYPPCQDVVVSTWAANSVQDGSGSNLTSTTTKADVSVELTAAQISFVNLTAGGYITQLEMRGRKWREVQETQDYQDSTTIYGKRSFWHDSPFLQDQAYLNAWVSILDGFLYLDREGITTQIEQKPGSQFGYELFEKIAYTAGTLTVDDDYYVLGLEHDWTRGAQGVTTTLWLRKIITNSSTITPKGFVEDMWQAPLGYDDPPGDTETVEHVDDAGGGPSPITRYLYWYKLINSASDYDSDSNINLAGSGTWTRFIEEGIGYTDSEDTAKLVLPYTGVWDIHYDVTVQNLINTEYNFALASTIRSYEADDTPIYNLGAYNHGPLKSAPASGGAKNLSTSQKARVTTSNCAYLKFDVSAAASVALTLGAGYRVWVQIYATRISTIESDWTT